MLEKGFLVGDSTAAKDGPQNPKDDGWMRVL